MHIPFPVLSDAALELTRAMKLAHARVRLRSLQPRLPHHPHQTHGVVHRPRPRPTRVVPGLPAGSSGQAWCSKVAPETIGVNVIRAAARRHRLPHAAVRSRCFHVTLINARRTSTSRRSRKNWIQFSIEAAYFVIRPSPPAQRLRESRQITRRLDPPRRRIRAEAAVHVAPSPTPRRCPINSHMRSNVPRNHRASPLRRSAPSAPKLAEEVEPDHAAAAADLADRVIRHMPLSREGIRRRAGASCAGVARSGAADSGVARRTGPAAARQPECDAITGRSVNSSNSAQSPIRQVRHIVHDAQPVHLPQLPPDRSR